jgi:hypothetical protein
MAITDFGDYHEAIENLRLNVSDEELRGGEVEVGPMGLPNCYSGNFAYVYKVHCPATECTWAVKCFTRDVPGLRDRYREIASYLERVELPYFVDFRYVEPGIRVAGEWRPFLKMRWVEGWRLDRLIAKLLDQPKKLGRLLEFWVRLAGRLRRAGIAHGDLQHQHVFFTPGTQSGQLSLKLIDYDGMYVPGLAGSPPTQVGHAAFQHPQSQISGAYGPEADRFSHLVVYCTLRCLLTGGRELWERYYNEDTLLMAPQDLAAPEQSPLFRELWRSPDAGAGRIVGHLILAAKGTPGDVPDLDHLVINSDVQPLSNVQQQQVDRAFSRGQWVKAETRMCEALLLAREVVTDFIALYPRCFPPIVFNVSGGGATDGDPEIVAAGLRDVATEDGNALLFNIYICAEDNEAMKFLGSDGRLNGQLARQLFRMSSRLPPTMIANANFPIASDAKGFAVNANLASVIHFLEIGTSRGGHLAVDAPGYSTNISVLDPTCFVLLIDQSEAMNTSVGGLASRKKADAAADAINCLLHALVHRTAKGADVLDRYYIAVIGYGDHVGPTLGGELAAELLVPVSQIAKHPLRIEARTQVVADGAGGTMEQIVHFPIWLEPGSRVQPEHDRRAASSMQQPAEDAPPLVFISAKSEDYPHAQRYYEYLTSRGVRAFLGAVSLAEIGSADYREAIDSALDAAKHMVVVTSSPENVRSSWVTAEWGLFVNEKRSDRKTGNLVTVVVGDMRIADLPPSLRYYEVIPDGPGSYEKVLSYVGRWSR